MFNKKVSYVFRIQKLFVFRFYEEKNIATGNCGGGDGGGGGGDGGGCGGGEGGEVRWGWCPPFSLRPCITDEPLFQGEFDQLIMILTH